jgi:hypothetical protein
MALRHAAALALVGWYLMMPPMTEKNEADAEGPLSKWQNDGSFDLASACEAVRHSLVNDLGTEKRTGTGGAKYKAK